MEIYEKKDYFVGIDSDGTIFDSMTIKHNKSFIPAAIEIFSLEEYSKEFTKIEEKINMYSLERGINRFPGLYRSFVELERLIGKKIFSNLNDFASYINSGFAFSKDGLCEYTKSNPSPILDKLMEWNDLCDAYFSKGTEGIMPFDNVFETVSLMHKSADIMVVSAAKCEGIKKDCSNSGIDKEFDFIAGQEFGKKDKQLLYALEKGYAPDKMLMIGDAPGDYDATKNVGILFYPIIPKEESECWKKLKEKYFQMFLEGRYSADIQKELYNNYLYRLENTK